MHDQILGENWGCSTPVDGRLAPLGARRWREWLGRSMIVATMSFALFDLYLLGVLLHR